MKLIPELTLLLMMLISSCVSAEESSAIVLLDKRLGRIHASYELTPEQSSFLSVQSTNFGRQIYQAGHDAGLSTGQTLGAGLAAGLIVGGIQSAALQDAADAQIRSLTSLFDAKELDTVLFQRVRDALKLEGIEKPVFIKADQPSKDLLERLDAKSRVASRLLIIAAEGMPWKLTADRRTVVLRIKIESYVANGQSFKLQNERRIMIVSESVKSESPDLALNEWTMLGKDGVLSILSDSMSRALRFGLSQDHYEKAREDQEVKFVNASGVFAVPGKLVDKTENRIVVTDYKGNIAEMIADFVF